MQIMQVYFKDAQYIVNQFAFETSIQNFFPIL